MPCSVDTSMPIIDEDTLETLKEAIESPDEYSSGADRNELRAAFDIASSQITHHVFQFEAENRMMLRRKLNAIKGNSVPEAYKALIQALKKALAASDPLQSKHYSDDDEETVDFIESKLAPLVQCLEELG